MYKFDRKDFDRAAYVALPAKEKNAYLRREIKKANARLLALERAGMTENSVYRYIRSFLKQEGKENVRFSSKLPRNINDRKALIDKLERFLNAKTSVVSEAKAYNSKKEQRLNNMGIYDIDKFSAFVKSGAYESLRKTYYESTLFDIYAEYEEEFDVPEMLELFDKINSADVAPDIAHESLARSIRMKR